MMWISRYIPKRTILVTISWYWMLLVLFPSASAFGFGETQIRSPDHDPHHPHLNNDQPLDELDEEFLENQEQQLELRELQEPSLMQLRVTKVFGVLFGTLLVAAFCCLAPPKRRDSDEEQAEEARAAEQEKEHLRQYNRIKAIFQSRGLQMKLDAHHFFHQEEGPLAGDTSSASSSSDSDRNLGIAKEKQELPQDHRDLSTNIDDTPIHDSDHPHRNEEDDVEMGASQTSSETEKESRPTAKSAKRAIQNKNDVSIVKVEIPPSATTTPTAKTSSLVTNQEHEDGDDSDRTEHDIKGRDHQDCLLDASAPSADNDDGDDHVVLKIPQRNGEPSSERSIPNLCAICLDGYQTGHTIVWSSNKACRHAFHQSCIVDYIISQRQVQHFSAATAIESQDSKRIAPCPICRQSFLPPQKEQKKTTTEKGQK